MVNPEKTIGRYRLAILDVKAIGRLPEFSLRRLLTRDRYRVLLANGRMIYFTASERRKYGREKTFHEKVLRVWGMCKSAGLRS